MGHAVQSIVTTVQTTKTAIGDLETALAACFDSHPDAEILRSLPGLGVVLGGRVLGEFGDEPTRFTNAVSRRCFAGTAPITRASGKSRVVLLRRARNQRLADACRWWAFKLPAGFARRAGLLPPTPCSRRHPRGGAAATGQQTRRPAPSWLQHREHYREDIAGDTDPPKQSTAA